MANQTKIDQSAKYDKVLDQLFLKTDDTECPFPIPVISSIIIPSGEQFGHSTFPIPHESDDKFDHYVGRVALRVDGPTKTKLDTRIGVYHTSNWTQDGKSENQNLILTGTLVNYVHDIGADTALAEIFDDRHILNKFTVFGRLIYDPNLSATQTNCEYFDASQPLIFNRGGWPDCLDTPNGPRFAPSYRYGYNTRYDTGSEDFVEPDPNNPWYQSGQNPRARSWRACDIAKYLRQCYSAGELYDRGNAYGNLILPSFIIWDESADAILGADRVIRNFNIEGKSLLYALQMLARRAGAYDVYVEPLEEMDKSEDNLTGEDQTSANTSGQSPRSRYQSKITFVNMNPIDPNAGLSPTDENYNFNMENTVELKLPEPGADITCGDPTVIRDGYIKESAVNHYHEATILGESPAIELFLSTDTTGYGAYGLSPAWSAADETAYKQYIKDFGGNREAFENACRIWPYVYCAYRVSDSLQPWLDTKYSALSNTYTGLRYHMLTHLLTGATLNSNNPDFWEPLPIIVEYLDETVTPNKWTPCHRYDFASLSPDGLYLYLDGLRDHETKPHTWWSSDPSWYIDPPTSMKATKIRISVAIYGGWKICGRATDDPTGATTRISDKWKYNYIALGDEGDYRELLRQGVDGATPHTHDSHPRGSQIPATYRDPPQRTMEGSELYSDLVSPTGDGRIVQHAKKRQLQYNRVEYTGHLILGGINPSLKPGTIVKIVSFNTPHPTIPITGVIKSIEHSVESQATIVELISHDREGIYDSNASLYSTQMPAIDLGAGPITAETIRRGFEMEYQEKAKGRHWLVQDFHMAVGAARAALALKTTSVSQAQAIMEAGAKAFKK